MFERQIIQIPFTIAATWFVLYLGEIHQVESKTWVWLCLGLIAAIAHQTYVWFFWRLELIHQWVSKKFGDKGFNFFAVGFFILITSRLITAIMLAYYDKNSIHIRLELWWFLVITISFLSGYTFYSVARYFGFKRAVGADHFFEEYRSMPFVKKGMFRFTSNSMYTFGTLIICLPGIIAESYLAIILGVFNYIYAWIHYFCLEKPDIEKIYQNS
jgi:phospholipid methyltransferase